jgi:type I restriction enzyme ecoAI specificity protein
MNTPQLADSLRAAVLQAAIKGELTERSSENARDLLLQIQTEKADLQQKGSLKKTKAPAPVTADEVPFDIPENWVWVRLGEIGETNIGLTYDKKDISDKGTIILRSGNIQNDKIDLSDVVKINADIPQNKMCQKGDILICARNGSKSLVGKSAIINEEGFSFGAFMAIFRSPFNPYIFYYLQSPLFRSAFDGVGTTTINQITQDNLRNRLIPLPPLAEQQAIVEKLTRLLAEIDRLKAEEQSLASLQKAYPQTLRASVLAAAVRGDLNERSQEHARDLLLRIQNEKQALQAKGSLKKTKAPAPVTADEVPFDIPENWVWVRLGDVTDYGIGKQTPSEKIPAGSLIVEMEDIEKETYRLLDKNRERTPKSSKNSFVAGDVLYGKLRPYLKKVVVADESGFCSTEIIPFNGFGKINPQYLMFCMTSPFMLSSVNQLTYGMDMPRLGTNDAKNLLIPLPPLAEQQAIVEKLSALLAEIDALENA